MSCRNCNTQSWRGEKGDTGAPGDNGINGINGIYLLTGDPVYITPVNNSGSSPQTLMSYNLQQASVSPTPFEDGDILEIEGRLTSDGLNTQKSIDVLFGGVPLIILAQMFGYNAMRLVFKLIVTRIDATNVRVEGFIENFNGFVNSTWQGSYYSNPVPVANMDTSDNLIELQVTGVVANDTTAQYLRIKLIKA